MTIQKVIHSDGSGMVIVTIGGVREEMTLGEWSKLIATAKVIEEQPC
jgi:hypothetical protein